MMDKTSRSGSSFDLIMRQAKVHFNIFMSDITINPRLHVLALNPLDRVPRISRWLSYYLKTKGVGAVYTKSA